MKVTAKLNYLRISPRKVRSVVDVVRGMNAKEALSQLKFMAQRPAVPVAKLLASAMANAEHNFSLSPESLEIALIKVDGGPVLRRFRPGSRGRVSPLAKKTSHITVILEGERTSTGARKQVDVQDKKEESLEGRSLKEKDAITTRPDAKKGAAFRKDSKIKVGSNQGFVKRMFQRKSI